MTSNATHIYYGSGVPRDSRPSGYGWIRKPAKHRPGDFRVWLYTSAGEIRWSIEMYCGEPNGWAHMATRHNQNAAEVYIIEQLADQGVDAEDDDSPYTVAPPINCY